MAAVLTLALAAVPIALPWATMPTSGSDSMMRVELTGSTKRIPPTTANNGQRAKRPRPSSIPTVRDLFTIASGW